MNKKYEILCRQMHDIFCISEVLCEYCKTRNNDEEIRRIIPIVELLYRNADDLNVKILQMTGVLGALEGGDEFFNVVRDD